MGMTTEQLTAEIQKGVFKPHLYLTNVCLAYFQSMAGFVAKKGVPHRTGPDQLCTLLRV